MDTILKMVLASGNKEQNQHYPPHIFQQHFNLATSWLIDEIVRLFPKSQELVDLLRPFLETRDAHVKNGIIEFPEGYRHLLGVGCFVADDFKSPCGCDEAKSGNCGEFKNDPLAPVEVDVKVRVAKKRCISRPVTMWTIS